MPNAASNNRNRGGGAEVIPFSERGTRLLLVRAKELYESGSDDDALVCLRQALDLNPISARLLLELGQELSCLDAYEEAADCLTRSWRLDRQNPEPLRHVCRILIRYQERLDEAEALIEEALQFDVPPSALELSRADLLVSRGEFDGGKALYEKLLAREPENDEAIEGLAVAYSWEASELAEEEKYEQAVFLVKRALDLLPDWAGLHVNLGCILMNMGCLSRARKSFMTAISLDPEDPGALYHLSVMARKRGRQEESRRYLEQVMLLDRGFPGCRPDMAELLHGLGRTEEAVGLMEEELEENPDCPHCQHAMGLYLLEAKQRSRAMIHFQEAAELDEDFFSAHYQLAMVMACERRIEEALAALGQAFRIDPHRAIERLSSSRDDFAPLERDPRFVTLVSRRS